MKIIHIMADGLVRESVDGLVIKSPQFYQTLNNIQQELHRRKKHERIDIRKVH